MTSYERITMAIDRIKTKGWFAGSMEGPNGEGCLYRSLLSDSENDLRSVVSNTSLVLLPASAHQKFNEINFSVAAVTSLLGFGTITDAIRWNDEHQVFFELVERPSRLSMIWTEHASVQLNIMTREVRKRLRTTDEILARLEAARDALIHQEIDKALHAEAAVAGTTLSAPALVPELVGA